MDSTVIERTTGDVIIDVSNQDHNSFMSSIQEPTTVVAVQPDTVRSIRVLMAADSNTIPIAAAAAQPVRSRHGTPNTQTTLVVPSRCTTPIHVASDLANQAQMIEMLLSNVATTDKPVPEYAHPTPAARYYRASRASPPPSVPLSQVIVETPPDLTADIKIEIDRGIKDHMQRIQTSMWCVPKPCISYMSKIVVIFTVMLFSIINLSSTTDCTMRSLWASLLSLSVGYIIPAPRLDETVHDTIGGDDHDQNKTL